MEERKLALKNIPAVSAFGLPYIDQIPGVQLNWETYWYLGPLA